MKFIATPEEALEFLSPEEARRACVITDPRLPDNPIVYVTPAFERRTGYTRNELLGRNCRIFQGEGTNPEEVARIRRAVWEMQPVSASLLNYRKDGRPFVNTFSIRPCFGRSGELRSFVSVERDLADIDRETETFPQRIGAAIAGLAGLSGRFARAPGNAAVSPPGRR